MRTSHASHDKPFVAPSAAARGGSPGRTWRVAAAITRTLAAFLLIDSTFSLHEQLARWRGEGPRTPPCPALYLGIQELLVHVSPRAARVVPVTVCFLRAASTATALALVAGAVIRIGTHGRWRIRTFELVAILVASAAIGLVVTGLTLMAAQEKEWSRKLEFTLDTFNEDKQRLMETMRVRNLAIVAMDEPPQD